MKHKLHCSSFPFLPSLLFSAFLSFFSLLVLFLHLVSFGATVGKYRGNSIESREKEKDRERKRERERERESRVDSRGELEPRGKFGKEMA